MTNSPQATGRESGREGGSEVEPGVRIPVGLCSSRPLASRALSIFARKLPMADFSVKEKDEASPPNCLRRTVWDAFILRVTGSEGFLFSGFALVSQL